MAGSATRAAAAVLLASCATDGGGEPIEWYEPSMDRAELRALALGAEPIEAVAFGDLSWSEQFAAWATGPLLRRGDEHRLAIYHAGHGDTPEDKGAETIMRLLDEGWAVLALDMPPGPHSRFEGELYPMRHFVAPVIAALDWAMLLQEWTHVRMVGLSGGGWTTVLVAALDERIDSAVCVAGILPPELRDLDPASYGDFEQRWTYGLEYDLLALGQPTLIYNRDDPCCFPGRLFDEYGFKENVRGVSVYVEDNQEHTIGPEAVRLIAHED